MGQDTSTDDEQQMPRAKRIRANKYLPHHNDPQSSSSDDDEDLIRHKSGYTVPKNVLVSCLTPRQEKRLHIKEQTRIKTHKIGKYPLDDAYNIDGFVEKILEDRTLHVVSNTTSASMGMADNNRAWNTKIHDPKFAYPNPLASLDENESLRGYQEFVQKAAAQHDERILPLIMQQQFSEFKNPRHRDEPVKIYSPYSGSSTVYNVKRSREAFSSNDYKPNRSNDKLTVGDNIRSPISVLRALRAQGFIIDDKRKPVIRISGKDIHIIDPKCDRGGVENSVHIPRMHLSNQYFDARYVISTPNVSALKLAPFSFSHTRTQLRQPERNNCGSLLTKGKSKAFEHVRIRQSPEGSINDQ